MPNGNRLGNGGIRLAGMQNASRNDRSQNVVDARVLVERFRQIPMDTHCPARATGMILDSRCVRVALAVFERRFGSAALQRPHRRSAAPGKFPGACAQSGCQLPETPAERGDASWSPASALASRWQARPRTRGWAFSRSRNNGAPSALHGSNYSLISANVLAARRTCPQCVEVTSARQEEAVHRVGCARVQVASPNSPGPFTARRRTRRRQGPR